MRVDFVKLVNNVFLSLKMSIKIYISNPFLFLPIFSHISEINSFFSGKSLAVPIGFFFSELHL